VLQLAGYQPINATMRSALETHTARTLQNQAGADGLRDETVLFRLGGEPYTVANWLDYARNFHVNDDGSGERPFAQLWQQYLEAKTTDHYQQHLETYNAEFRNQMAEFREGNLFFEVMQREIWGPVQNDSSGQRSYYEAHKAEYRWYRSADAVLFYVGDAATARKLAAQVQKTPAKWRTLAAQYGDGVAADSARFEWSTLPGMAGLPAKAGTVGKVQVTEADGSATFALVLKGHNQPVQRSFAEARGAVINDYQALKERQWVDSLRNKYPVKINSAELAKLTP
jgi:peptidyl-prolyl cis-trans isomerase SurA